MRSKLLIALSSSLITSLLLIGCNTVAKDNENNEQFSGLVGSQNCNIIVDNETGVNYIIYKDDFYTDRSGIVVRYNNDGSVYVTK